MLTQIRRRRTGAAIAALTVVAAITLSACSSSGSSDSSTSGNQGGSTGSASADVTNAKAFLKKYTSPPQVLNLTTPLPKKAPTGKTLVWMQCDAAQCAESAKLLKEATAAVGWNLKIVNYQTANPATLVAGLKQALQYKPVAVALVGLPIAVWGSVVPAYKAAGVAIVPEYVGDVPIDSTVVANIAGSTDSGLWGKILANWFIADSNGTGKALLVTVPELGTAKSFRDGFDGVIKSGCSKCSVTHFEESFADVAAGKRPAAIVSQLQQKSDIKYLISANQALNNGVPQAIKAAGLTNIKQAGTSAEKNEEAQVKSGVLDAVTPTALNFGAWLVVDAALRFSIGATQPKATPLNTMLITKDSPITPSDDFNYPSDWQAQFKKLWLVG